MKELKVIGQLKFLEGVAENISYIDNSNEYFRSSKLVNETPGDRNEAIDINFLFKDSTLTEFSSLISSIKQLPEGEDLIIADELSFLINPNLKFIYGGLSFRSVKVEADSLILELNYKSYSVETLA